MHLHDGERYAVCSARELGRGRGIEVRVLGAYGRVITPSRDLPPPICIVGILEHPPSLQIKADEDEGNSKRC